MRIRSYFRGGNLNSELGKKLDTYRRHRGFNAAAICSAKITLINTYFAKNKLSSAVIAVSGGIDSAVVLGLLKRARAEPGSPIKKIAAVTLPVFTTRGVTGQTQATALAQKVGAAYGLNVTSIDLSLSFTTLQTAIETVSQLTASPWAQGQLASYLRTPTLYYLTSLLTEVGIPAVVCGTTNRDEGAYLGFFGKASDGMVDLQLIADLHKSEVYTLGDYLGIPEEILERPPTGDMFDAALDEQVFGTPYDFVELYLHFLTLPKNAQQDFFSSLSLEARTEFNTYQNNLEKLHQYNAHKYKVGSPAVHLNVYHSGVPGGWHEPEVTRISAPDSSRFINEHKLSPEILSIFSTTSALQSPVTPVIHPSGLVWKTEKILTTPEVNALQTVCAAQPWQPTDIHGTLKNFNPAQDEIGSYRLSWYSPELAHILWQRLAGTIPMIRTFNEKNHPEGGKDEVWRACGINELFRAIRYKTDGWLVPHYDAPFVYHATKRTILSLIIYLNDTPALAGGATRFLHEKESNKQPGNTRYADWEHPPQSEDIITKIIPHPGDALIFDHRLLHDGERFTGPVPKTIIRTDIVYERIDTRYV